MDIGQRVRKGMLVVSADGVDLGRVVRFDEFGFRVEKGVTLTEEIEVRYEDVASVTGSRVLVTRRRHDYVEAANGEPIVTEDELAEVARGELSKKELQRTVDKL